MHQKGLIPYIITIYLGKFNFIIVYFLKISLVHLIYSFCLFCVVYSYHCLDLCGSKTTFCTFKRRKLTVTFTKRIAIGQLSICHLKNLWIKKVKTQRLTQNFNMFCYHFPVTLFLHIKHSVKCHAWSWRGDRKGANAIQSTYHHTSASDKPVPFIQSDLLAQQLSFCLSI